MSKYAPQRIAFNILRSLFLLFLRIQKKSIFLKVAFFQSFWLPPQKNSVRHLMVLLLFTRQSPNGRDLDDANDKLKIFYVKMSVSPVR
jgi:hypothetical protein